MNRFSFKQQEKIIGWIFILPWVIGFIWFIAGPMLFSLIASFTNYTLVTEVSFVGLENYQTMFFEDPTFWVSFKNTFYYAIVAIPIMTVGGLLLAVFLNNVFIGQRFFRTVYYLPTMLVGVGMCLLWMLLLSPDSGLVNQFLALFGIDGPAWLSDPNWTKPSIILMNIWALGGQMLLYLARLQAIPGELYEAAEVEGASSLKKFTKITIPMLSPIIFFNLVVGTIGAFQIFQEGYILSSDGLGGPAQSLLFYNLYLWQNAFVYFNTAYACAMSWFLFIIIFVITMLNQSLSKRWVFEEAE